MSISVLVNVCLNLEKKEETLLYACFVDSSLLWVWSKIKTKFK